MLSHYPSDHRVVVAGEPTRERILDAVSVSRSRSHRQGGGRNAGAGAGLHRDRRDRHGLPPPRGDVVFRWGRGRPGAPSIVLPEGPVLRCGRAPDQRERHARPPRSGALGSQPRTRDDPRDADRSRTVPRHRGGPSSRPAVVTTACGTAQTPLDDPARHARVQRRGPARSVVIRRPPPTRRRHADRDRDRPPRPRPTLPPPLPAPQPAASGKAAEPYDSTPVTAPVVQPGSSDRRRAQCALKPRARAAEGFDDTKSRCPKLATLFKPRVAAAAIGMPHQAEAAPRATSASSTSRASCKIRALGSACRDPAGDAPPRLGGSRAAAPPAQGRYNKMSRESCEAERHRCIADSKRALHRRASRSRAASRPASPAM